MFDKGKDIEKRKCFVTSDTPCKKCKVCSITHGVGGTGSFSDSKLNFDITGRVGGDLAELLTEKEIEKYLNHTYDIYNAFGVDEFKSKVYGTEYNNEAKDILNIIKNNPNLDIAECPTIHLGTENSRIIYKRMIDFLKEHGAEIKSNCEIITIKDKWIYYLQDKEYKTYIADKVVLAMGRAGNELTGEICKDNNIKIKNGRVDYGVRIETLDEIMQPLNKNFYESKIYFQGTFGDKARMFCSNPSGYVAVESYPYGDKKIFTANGHAYANKKSNNTNFAILVSRNFNEDCPKPLEDYMYPLINATNSLGKGSVILQSLKDIKLHRRSTKDRIEELDIKPTANVYAGDLTSVVPYRTLVTILEFIEELDEICPGINGDNTLLYGLEAKFHSNKVLIDKHGKTSNPNVYCIGDCSGWTRGITSASSMGILCAEDILKEDK